MKHTQSEHVTDFLQNV